MAILLILRSIFFLFLFLLGSATATFRNENTQNKFLDRRKDGCITFVKLTFKSWTDMVMGNMQKVCYDEATKNEETLR